MNEISKTLNEGRSKVGKCECSKKNMSLFLIQASLFGRKLSFMWGAFLTCFLTCFDSITCEKLYFALCDCEVTPHVFSGTHKSHITAHFFYHPLSLNYFHGVVENSCTLQSRSLEVGCKDSFTPLHLAPQSICPVLFSACWEKDSFCTFNIYQIKVHQRGIFCLVLGLKNASKRNNEQIF